MPDPQPITVADLIADLDAEQRALDAVVAPLPDDEWALATPSPGWAVAHQIAHLLFFDRAAALAIVDPEAFAAHRTELLAGGSGDGGIDDSADAASLAPAELLDAWRDGRRRLAEAAAGLADGDRVEWYGPSMSARSFLTARLMEAWAHGQDIVDAVDGERPATDRLRHVAQLGVITRRWSYINRGLTVPEADVRVELVAPSGARWEWGPTRADDLVRGGAEHFCLVVTQRRHVDDTDLQVEGPAAHGWLERAQAFAGSPTDGPKAGSFR